MENDKKINNEGLAFSKKGIPFFLAGVILVIIGFFLMSGGKSDNPEVFNPEVFNHTRITTAPVLVLLGFIVAVIGIMLKPKN